MIPTYIIIHHSLTKDSETVSWQAIRKYHMSFAYDGNIITKEEAEKLISKGKNVKLPWDDIGYHFGIELVDNEYEILGGRLMNKPGAHCKENGMNQKSVGICVVGNFDEDEPPKRAWDLCLAVTSSLCHMLKIPVDKVQGHREHTPYKTCPGKKWDMMKFRDELRDIV